MPGLRSTAEEHLYKRIASILEQARAHAARSVNTAMVHAYWLVGREIVEGEQQGLERAGYGEELLTRLATKLSRQFGKGFNATNLKRMRQFYRAFPTGSCLPGNFGSLEKGATAKLLVDKDEKGASLRHQSLPSDNSLFPPVLSWTHYRLLLIIDKPEARSFYEIEAAREGWSVRELERQIASLLFERLTMSREPEQARVLARQGQKVAVPDDVIKDPFVTSHAR